MVTVPLVLLLGFIAWLMVRKGGWKFAPLGLGFLVGLLTATTPFGPELTQMIHQVIKAGSGAITASLGGVQ